ncbi:hypothetical protein NliqN6_2626 [Naganishia liquefaciens]|uniref:Rhodanese domain-containing protein n=1 Tax=Naganishia liquefaciens TaxID=104408 RepID=A0A8H3TU49_9TREE|nr:hypothetical protein NliqN6_2626 [Naganishia liquefaciens]
MSFTPSFQYINAQELAEIVKKNDPKEVQVIDVRDDDFVGGNIKGAVNSPSESFTQNVTELVRQYEEVPKIVFHCALSQQRGPKAARIYSEIQKQLNPDSRQEVLVLREGFTGFQQRYRDDPALVEKFNKMYHD